MDSKPADDKDAEQALLEELSLLLENRSFIDYFNIFLSLPVFGQHVFYNYMETEFEFEPPIRKRRHLFMDQREVLKWLCKERFTLFKRSPLYTEYQLCNVLKHTDVDIAGIKSEDETGEGEDVKTFCRNLIGNATGMLLFRESMRGTCGEHVYRCWKDVQAWSQITDDARRLYWKRAIKTKYIYQNSASQLRGRMKMEVFKGHLNFDVIPEKDIQDVIFKALLSKDGIITIDSDQGLEQLQVVLLEAMKRYWLPRYLLRIKATSRDEDIAILKRPAPADLEYLSHERRLRCRFMFPTVYQDSVISTPTTVFTSRSVGDVPGETPTDEESISEEEELVEEEIRTKDLFSIWGGPTQDVDIDDDTSSSESTVTPGDSPDLLLKRRLRFNFDSPAKVVQSPIPIVLTSYLGGKKRTLLGKFPSTSNRIIWSLASDALASNPFRYFLFQNGYTLDLHYLSFWQDVRTYLDTDDSTLDSLGHPLRRLLANRICATYLTHSGEGGDIFSESLKTSLHMALSNNNDVSLLCMAQDIVLEGLWEPLKQYIEDERRRFLKQVRGNRYNMDYKTRKGIDRMVSRARPSSCGKTDGDPMYFYQCSTLETGSESSHSPAVGMSPAFPRASTTMSRPATSYHICISEEQMWKAMEMTVLCCEYGMTMMLPQYPPTTKHLVDILYSDYGSLHVSRVPAQRQEWLRNMVYPPKINIETIRVSRKVILDKLDLTKKEKDPDKDPETRQRNRLTYRRNGMVLERPTKPKSFGEVLTTQTHLDFFKRFMVVHKAGLPLMFWKAIEDLRDLSNSKTRQIRVSQIVRKFFGKYAKYGALLDCHEEIIRQIPSMDKVTPGILICAQAAVYRSMERKWYPVYLESYPPESDTSSSETNIMHIRPCAMAPDMFDVLSLSKKPKKKVQAEKTLMLWKGFTRALAMFYRSLQKQSEMQLLEFYLKCEVEREQHQPIPKDGDNTAQMPTQIEKNIQSSLTANVQTRVVIRNRLVILNRLPADLRFWKEVEKYQRLVDSSMKSGSFAAQDTEFLCDKGRAVISCYLASDVPPRVQINVPNDMALSIINTLASAGPIRGLFHDAMVLLFPLLYHYWRKFTDEWIKGDIPEEYLEAIEKSLRGPVSSVPHVDCKANDYTDIKTDEMKTITQLSFDDFAMKIHFSIMDGVVIIYPQQKQHQKVSENGGPGRRMTKQSLHGLPELASTSPRKESKLQVHVHDKKDGRHTAKSERHKDDHKRTPPKEKHHSPSKDKKKKKSVNKLEDGTTVLSSNKSSERARRLSQLVENLNTEREEKIKTQNRKFSKLLSFDEVVSAAIRELSESNSVFS